MHSRSLPFRRVNLIEYATVGKMSLLNLCPSSVRVDRHHLDLGELTLVLFRSIGKLRSEEMLTGDILTGGRVQELKKGLGGGSRPTLVDDLVDDGHRRFGANGDGRHHDLELARSIAGGSKERIILPGDQDVADT